MVILGNQITKPTSNNTPENLDGLIMTSELLQSNSKRLHLANDYHPSLE